MAANSCALQVTKCSLHRPSLPSKLEHPLSSTFKPEFRDLDQFPNISVDVPKAIKETSFKLLDGFVDFMFEFVDQPLLPSQSNFAPVEEIVDAKIVRVVEGKIPDDFPEGVYIRNGPNPLFGGLKSTRSVFGESSHMWVEGEGMLHALYLKKDSGRRWKTSYKNKHVQTDTYNMEKDRKKPGFLPAIQGDSPAKAPGTGELVIIGIDAQKPYLELGVISVDGKKMVHKVDLMLDRCTVCHEIGVTHRYNVIMDFPLTIDISRLVLGGQLMRFEKDGYARIGIMPRYGYANSIKWFEVEPCCVFHIINCFEDNDEVVVRACRARQSVIPGHSSRVNHFQRFSKWFKSSAYDITEFTKESTFPSVCEWRLNMKTGEVREKKNLSGNEFAMEFPIINEKFTGFRNKFAYLQIVELTEVSGSGFTRFGGLVKLHFEENTDELIKGEYHMFPKNTFCSGASFVPKPGGGDDEDDGWIITFTHNENENISQVYIIDAKKFRDEPVAVITLSSRVPYGFHGAFMPLKES